MPQVDAQTTTAGQARASAAQSQEVPTVPQAEAGPLAQTAEAQEDEYETIFVTEEVTEELPTAASGSARGFTFPSLLARKSSATSTHADAVSPPAAVAVAGSPNHTEHSASTSARGALPVSAQAWETRSGRDGQHASASRADHVTAPAMAVTASIVAAQPHHVLNPSIQTTVGGWVVAASLLLAARLSREEADSERLDLQALQARQSESRVQSAELRALRRAFLEQERLRKEAEAAQRLEEARKRAEAEAVAKAQREAAYREAAAKETARLWAEQQAARQEFLEMESRAAEELARRTAREVELREQEAARKRQEAEQRRVAAELRRERDAQDAARRAEEERRAAAVAAAAAAEAARHRQALQAWYCLELCGTATVQQAAPGTLTTQSSQAGWNRGPQIARLTLHVSLTSGPAATIPPRVALDAPPDVIAATPPPAPVPWEVPRVGPCESSAAYDSATSALEASSELTGQVTALVLDQLWGHVTACADVAQAPGADVATVGRLDTAELQHWRRVAAACCEAATRQAIAQVGPLAERTPLEQPYAVSVTRAVLPPDHPNSVRQRMARAVQAVQQERLDDAVQLVNSVLHDEVASVAGPSAAGDGGPLPWPTTPRSLGITPPPHTLPPLTLLTLLYAWVVDQAGAPAAVPFSDAASSLDGPDTHQRALRLATYQLQQAARKAPSDALTPTASCVRVALGPDHPLSRLLGELADQNLSAASRLRQEARKQQAEFEVAAALLRAQDPAGAQRLDPNDPSARQALVPVPERLWAVRNVAGSMARFGDPTQASEAIGMLLDACDLAASHYGPTHPSCAAPLLDTRDVLQVALAQCQEEDEERKATLRASCDDVTRQLCDIMQAVAERYTAQADLLSVVLLYESAVRELGPVTVRSPPALAAIERTAANLMFQLTPQEARAVMSRRKTGGGGGGGANASVLRSLAREFTEELGVYSNVSSGSRRASRLEQWRTGQPLRNLAA